MPPLGPATLQAYALDGCPVPPLPVAGVRFAVLVPGQERALADAMGAGRAEVFRRLAGGGEAAVALLTDDSIAAYGWVSYDAVRLFDLHIAFPLPAGHAYIWDCATLVELRGRGIFPGLLRFLLEEMRVSGVRHAWAGVAASNGSSLRSFARAGFRFVAEASIQDGQTTLRMTDGAQPEEAQVLTAIGAR